LREEDKEEAGFLQAPHLIQPACIASRGRDVHFIGSLYLIPRLSSPISCTSFCLVRIVTDTCNCIIGAGSSSALTRARPFCGDRSLLYRGLASVFTYHVWGQIYCITSQSLKIGIGWAGWVRRVWLYFALLREMVSNRPSKYAHTRGIYLRLSRYIRFAPFICVLVLPQGIRSREAHKKLARGPQISRGAWACHELVLRRGSSRLVYDSHDG
jgi:hypothetical protein